MVRQVAATRTVVGYAVRLAQGSRPNHPEAPAFIKEWVNWGAGPRASQYLVWAPRRVLSYMGALSLPRMMSGRWLLLFYAPYLDQF